jgi:plasmid stabilization system protein ParE
VSSRPGPKCAIVFSHAIADNPLARPVQFAAQAQLDIDRLHAWLFEKNADAAFRLIMALQAHCVSLTDFPKRGRVVDHGIRELIVPFGGSNYVVRYEVSPKGVFISRIWHGLEQR